MKIGFVYEPFDARAGSFGAHGYFLASEFVRRGHELLGPGLPEMPGLVSLPNNKWGKLKMARHADLLYIRVGILHWLERCTWLRLLRPSCPVVWEINAASEEILGSDSPPPAALRQCRKDLRRKRRMARLVDAAVCVTQSLAEYARECYGIERCIVAPNGGDPASYRNGGGTFLADLKDRFTVLWAGRADGPWHGLEQILAAARVCEEAAPDVLFVLILAGAPPHAMPHCRNVLTLRETDRPTAVRYLADADCAAVIYRRCDWRRTEGSPLKLYEAMAARKPVIASAIGQIREVLRDGVDGLLVDESPDGLVRAILRLRHDPALRERMASSARARLESGYTWRHTVDRIEPLLIDLVQRRRHTVTRARPATQWGTGVSPVSKSSRPGTISGGKSGGHAMACPSVAPPGNRTT